MKKVLSWALILSLCLCLLSVSALADGTYTPGTYTGESSGHDAGLTVTVTVDGKLYGEYPLARDTAVEILSESGHNLLVIRDGAALVEDASCPDGICAAHRPISRNGESIICLPNKVVISVSSESENEPDLPA